MPPAFSCLDDGIVSESFANHFFRQENLKYSDNL